MDSWCVVNGRETIGKCVRIVKVKSICEVKIYPPQGTTKMDGHAMASAPSVWFAEVLPWINKMVGQK